MNYTLEKVEGFSFIGLPLRTENQKGEAEVLIPLHWERFFKENILEKIPGRLDNQVLAVYTDYEREETNSYTFIIGCVVEEGAKAPEGLTALFVPEMTYAVFEAKGSFPYSLVDTWQSIRGSSLKRRFTTDFEVYGAKFQNTPSQLDVYIAIDDMP